ncbi:MAG: choice-of-anchor B family protein, partial [Acidobacteria bacterium]|nr:choice-of-anchor B family protein [Acidobacteriota bacterium]
MKNRFLIVVLLSTLAGATCARAQALPCVGGMAGIYPCSNVTLMSRLSSAELGTVAASDNWGWEDPQTGVEYALVAAREGTIFVSLQDPEAPVVIGTLPAHNGIVTFIRDLKVHADHAFIVADSKDHGMQVFDLTQLRDVVAPPVVFSETAHYNGISDAHNIAINLATAFAYAVTTDTCIGGLHMIDLSTPTTPVFAGCYSAVGSIH